MKNKEKKKKQPNPYLIFVGNTFQMGITIYLSSQLGKWIDNSFGFEKFFTLIMTLLGFLLSFYVCYITIKKIDN